MEKAYIILKNGKPASKFIFRTLKEAEELMEMFKDAYPKSQFECEELSLYQNYSNLVMNKTESEQLYKNINEKAVENVLYRKYAITLKNADTNNYEKAYISAKQALECIQKLKRFNEDFIIKAKNKTTNSIHRYVVQEQDYCKMHVIRAIVMPKYNKYLNDLENMKEETEEEK